MEPGARSGILSFHRSDITNAATVAALQDRGIYIGLRKGTFRASPHYYNFKDEIDALVNALL
jgi:selenocysteine lyase/cysteine desulfurase